MTSLHRQLGMTDDEYASVVEILDRDPEPAELAMYSVMWSEHCSYKSSRAHLGRFPTEGARVVVGPGENAGVVDLGDGWLAAIRIESHNHPSYVEPYQGAATGVGGMLRDIFTMGARPIALWDAIRFGPLDDAKNRYLFDGVVKGIAGYGNAVGVPTVGGELEFDDSYAHNPLVNVMCLGIMRSEQLQLGSPGQVGDVGILLGASTGRDGIGGASILASAAFEPGSEDKRPSVQVGDPFEEKKLIEACLELYEKDLVTGVQDLGAAGLSCATSEPPSRAGVGMDVDLDAVHLREEGMTAAEILMSESQERMLAFVQPSNVDKVLEIARRWEIESRVIGTVTPGKLLRVFHRGEKVVEIPAASLTEDAPKLYRNIAQPAWQESLWASNPIAGSRPTIDETLIALLDDPGLGDTSFVYEQYDHMLFLNTLVGPGNDGTLLRIKGTTKALAGSVDGNGRLCYLDPRRGSERLVYEAALNVAVTGARPLAVVDNLNFGNPEQPEVMWQFTESIEGISIACEALAIPVVGGNVSFYNEGGGSNIHPTPVVGMLGLADPVPHQPPRLDRAEEGMEIWMLGDLDTIDLAGSAAQRIAWQELSGRPVATDPDLARRLTEAAATLAHMVPVLHDVGRGGLALALAEIAIESGVGVDVPEDRWDHLFGEAPHRLIVISPTGGPIETIAAGLNIEARRIGTVAGDRVDIGGSNTDLLTAKRVWQSSIRSRI